MALAKALGSVGFTLGLVVICSCKGGLSSMCSGGHLSVSSGVVATPPFDSVEIFIDGEAVDSTGTPCATATTGKCQTEYRAVASTKGARFVTTRGDEIQVLTQVSREHLGATTDTPEEATLVVMGWSLETACKAFDTIDARPVAAGFEVVATKASTRRSCTTEVETTTAVDPSGKRSEPVQVLTSSFGCDTNRLPSPWSDDDDRRNETYTD